MSGAIHKSADVNGQRIAYLERGEGRTLVFLHGMGGAPPMGANFVHNLASRHRVDPRGRGIRPHDGQQRVRGQGGGLVRMGVDDRRLSHFAS